MLIDNKILQRHGIYEVLGESQAIAFPDASTAVLHFVRRNGVDDIFLRAVPFKHGRWGVFDLRTLDRGFAIELPFALHRDRAGLVMFSLRALFDGAAPFQARCLQNLDATWLERAPMPHLSMAGVQTPAITFQPELVRAAA